MNSYLEEINIEDYSKEISINDLPFIIRKNKEFSLKYNLKEFKFPIVAGLLSSRTLFAKALGIQKIQIIPHILQNLNNLKEYTLVKNAPFQDNEIKFDKRKDISDYLPLIEFYEGKRYTTSSIIIVKYPNEERQNASFHRMMFLGDNQFAVRIVPQRHLDIAYSRAIKQGIDLDVAVIFGVHPAIEIASAFSTPELDELKLAASFMKGLDVCKLQNDIFVPCNSEFVLEGRITKNKANEGPFIDLTGTPDKIREEPILEVDKLYHRSNPIFRTILPGGKEHKMLMGIPQEPRIYKYVSNTIGTVKNVVLTLGGSSWLHAVISIKKRTEGDAKNAIIAALAAHPSLKRVIIVDEDIDITYSDDVEWAVATRFQPDKDLIIIPNSKGSSLDPSSNNSITCKWGLDATKPLKDNKEFNRVY